MTQVEFIEAWHGVVSRVTYLQTLLLAILVVTTLVALCFMVDVLKDWIEKYQSARRVRSRPARPRRVRFADAAAEEFELRGLQSDQLVTEV